MPYLLDFDLFISYSRDDNRQEQISEVVARIKKEYRDFTGGGELRVFFDKRELASMNDRRQNTLDAIRSSRLLLVCLSPNYLQSEYCSWATIKGSRLNLQHSKKIFYLADAHCNPNCRCWCLELARCNAGAQAEIVLQVCLAPANGRNRSYSRAREGKGTLKLPLANRID